MDKAKPAEADAPRGYSPLSGAVLLAALSLAGSAPAYAYVDPGTGSLVLQTIVALLAGALAVFRGWRLRLVNFFRRDKPSK